MGRPLPWKPQVIGTRGKPIGKAPLSWPQYAASLGPIPLQGPIGYVFDKLRENGASTSDANAILKGLITYGLSPQGMTIAGLGATGLHVREEPLAKKEPLHQAVARTRAAAQLQAH
jgi:hypothetical protein